MMSLMLLSSVMVAAAAAAADTMDVDVCDWTKCKNYMPPKMSGINKDQPCWTLDPRTTRPIDDDNSTSAATTTTTNSSETVTAEVVDDVEYDDEHPSVAALCSDGYIGHVVENIKSYKGYIYYACCPPPLLIKQPPLQCTEEECTAPEGYKYTCEGNRMSIPMTCSGKDGYSYPRKLRDRSRGAIDYACCKTPSKTTTKSGYTTNMVTMEVLRIIFAFVAMICTATLTIALLSSRECRSQPYNLYLIGLVIPDFIFNLTQFMEGLYGFAGRFGDYPYWLQIPIYFFNVHANIWINLVLANRVYFILQASHRANRIKPPTHKAVVGHIMVVYVFAITFVIVQEYYRDMDVYFTAFTVGCAFLYLPYVSIQVYFRKLLPLTGQTRSVAIFFFRIIASFFTFWIPSFGLMLGWEFGKGHIRTLFISIFLCSIQAIATFGVALTKQDVNTAVIENVWKKICCLCLRLGGDEEARNKNKNHHRPSTSSTTRTIAVNGNKDEESPPPQSEN